MLQVYEYTAADPRGALVTGRERAENESHLDSLLEVKGLILTNARSITADRSTRRTKLKRAELITITTQLSTIVGAGVPIVEGLEGIGKRLGTESSQRLIGEIVRGLSAGESLSQTLDPYDRAFPDVYRASIRAGEASGALDLVLARLAKYLEWARTMRSTTTQALIYPGILLGAIFGLVLLLLYFVLPKILTIFEAAGTELPANTRFVLALSGFLRGNALVLGLGAVAALVGFRMLWKRRRGRAWVHGLMLRVPLLGEVARQIATSKFASTASTLQAAGCDVFGVLEIASATCGNEAMSMAFERSVERVRRGEAISEAMAQEPLIDTLLIQMIGVGERSGSLDRSLEKLVEYYDDEVPRLVKRFLSLLEPLLLLGAGVVVGFILLAAIMPIFQLYEQM